MSRKAEQWPKKVEVEFVAGTPTAHQFSILFHRKINPKSYMITYMNNYIKVIESEDGSYISKETQLIINELMDFYYINKPWIKVWREGWERKYYFEFKKQMKKKRNGDYEYKDIEDSVETFEVNKTSEGEYEIVVLET